MAHTPGTAELGHATEQVSRTITGFKPWKHCETHIVTTHYHVD